MRKSIKPTMQTGSLRNSSATTTRRKAGDRIWTSRSAVGHKINHGLQRALSRAVGKNGNLVTRSRGECMSTLIGTSNGLVVLQNLEHSHEGNLLIIAVSHYSLDCAAFVFGRALQCINH